MQAYLILFTVLCVSASSLSCSDGVPTSIERQLCQGFSDWESSEYVLPYPVDMSYEVNQANCSGFGHIDFWTYGYDFKMDIGTKISAARAGVVAKAQAGGLDGSRTRTNLVTIEHEDGTVALYSHLTFDGALVRNGDSVTQGQIIGLSGDTGNTGGLPHLHFSLHPCKELPGLGVPGDCPTIPVTFRNTDPNPKGLVARRSYVAQPY